MPHVVQVKFSPCGTQYALAHAVEPALACVNAPATISVHDTATSACTMSLQSHWDQYSWSADGQQVVVLEQGKHCITILAVCAQSGCVLGTTEFAHDGEQVVSAVPRRLSSLSPFGQYVAIYCFRHLVEVPVAPYNPQWICFFDTVTGKAAQPQAYGTFQWHPNGHQIAFVDAHNTVVCGLCLTTGATLFKLRLDGWFIISIADWRAQLQTLALVVQRDVSRPYYVVALASMGMGGTADELVYRQCEKTFTMRPSFHISCSPNAKYVALSHWYSNTHIRDAASGQIVHGTGQLSTCSSAGASCCWCTSWSPDSKYVLYYDTEQSSITVVRTAVWHEVAVWHMPAAIKCVLFSPDGCSVAVHMHHSNDNPVCIVHLSNLGRSQQLAKEGQQPLVQGVTRQAPAKHRQKWVPASWLCWRA